jgi:outer membrane protein assembly factor BamB
MMSCLRRTRYAVASCLVLAACTLWAQEPARAGNDWPQWRGPSRDGRSTETGLLKEWPKDGPPLLWRVAGLGKGYSSVSITGGRILTMGDRGPAQYVIALDLASHKELWATKVGGPWRDGGPRCTPTVDGDLVYALGTKGDLVCLETATGREVWRKNFAKDFNGFMMSGWGYSESPLVDGDRLVCTPGGPKATLVALNKKTGEVVWKCATPPIGTRGKDGAGYSSIVVTEAGGVRQYVQTLGRGTVGVAAADGRFLWGYNRIANGTANITTPVVDGDLVFCTTSYKTGSALLRLVPGADKGIQAREVYFIEPQVFENHHGGVVLVDGCIYGGHGQNKGFPTCVDLKTGKVLWQSRGPGEGSAAVIYADGRLYFRYENGVVALIEATPKALTIRGTFQLPTKEGPSWPHPVLLDGKLYIRHHDALLCYNVKAGS